jgi:aldose 1-epimerase
MKIFKRWTPAPLLYSACICLQLTACSPAPAPGNAAIPTPTATLAGTTAMTLSIQHQSFGQLADGREVSLYKLTNANGVALDVTNYGGIITRLVTPDAKGQFADIVLGYDNLAQYVENNPYFGAIIGRYGNRIAAGKFALNGTTYQLATNDGANHLHGGVQGFDKKLWDAKTFQQQDAVGVVLSLVSPDGDQGYPGTLKVEVTYRLTNSNELQMTFVATTDKTTVVNLTQHSYFNLAGGGDILSHELMIPADRITPVGAGLIPTGELQDVTGTPFDFRSAKAIGRDIAAEDAQLKLGLGYDHNFVLKNSPDSQLVLAGRVLEPNSGRVLEVLTDDIAVQFYSGNFLDGTITGKGQTYRHRSGFCLEPQHFPDAPNQPGFASTVLEPGQTYQSRIVYRFSTQATKE